MYTHSQASPGAHLRIQMARELDTAAAAEAGLPGFASASGQGGGQGGGGAAGAGDSMFAGNPLSFLQLDRTRSQAGPSIADAVASGLPLTVCLFVPLVVVNATQLPISVGVMQVRHAPAYLM